MGRYDEQPEPWVRLNMDDEWRNGAYDEEGNDAVCDICANELKWNPQSARWCCSSCGQEIGRADYFNHIGANPPGEACVTDCDRNYPFCKKTCERFVISPDDPMIF